MQRVAVSAVGVQAAQGAQVGVLNEVVGVVVVAEVAAQAGDVVDGVLHEALERGGVAVLGAAQFVGGGHVRGSRVLRIGMEL